MKRRTPPTVANTIPVPTEPVVAANNVVMFPKKNPRNNYQSLEEIEARVKLNKSSFVSGVLQGLVTSVINNLQESGYAIEDDESARDVGLIIEAINSAWYRRIGLYHDLFVVADRAFESKVIRGKRVTVFTGEKDDIKSPEDGLPDITA